MDQELRSAIARGLHVDNLWAIDRLCTKLLQNDRLANQIVVFTIKAVSSGLAARQEGLAVSSDYADLASAHLLSAMERLLDAASRGPEELCDALNQLVIAFADTVPRS